MAKSESTDNKKIMSKVKKSSTPLEPFPMNLSWADYVSGEANKAFPETKNLVKRVALALLMWAEREDSLELVDFALGMKMDRQKLYDWSWRYPEEFGRAYEKAKLMIGSRRRKGALARKFSESMVLKDAHVYDSEWDAINKYHADLRERIAAAGSNQITVTELKKETTELVDEALKRSHDRDQSE